MEPIEINLCAELRDTARILAKQDSSYTDNWAVTLMEMAADELEKLEERIKFLEDDIIQRGIEADLEF